MNLHILTKPTIPTAVTYCAATDGIILFNEGVYIAAEQIPMTLKNHPIYILSDHWHARGGVNWQLANNIQVVDYDRFVQLCTQYTRCITW